MNDYSTDHAALQARVQKEKDEAFASKNWLEFISRHPELRIGGFANKNILISYFGTDYPANFTVDALEEALGNPELRKQLVIDDPDGSGDRNKLLAELQSVFHGPDHNWQNELLKTNNLTNDQIREKIASLREKHAMQKLSTDELRQVINGRPAPQQELLPATYTRRVLVKELRPAELLRIIAKYGRDQVNRRIAGITI